MDYQQARARLDAMVKDGRIEVARRRVRNGNRATMCRVYRVPGDRE